MVLSFGRLAASMSIADHAAAAHSGIHLIRADGVFAAATASIMPCCVGGREGGKGSDTIAKSNNYNFDRSDGQLSEIRNSTLDHTVRTCFVPRRGSLWCVTKQIFDSDHVACNLHCGLAKGYYASGCMHELQNFQNDNTRPHLCP